MTDPIADMLTRIRNAYSAEHEEVEIPFSNLKERIVNLLNKTGYLGKARVEGEKSNKKLILSLVYSNGRPAINKVEKVSKPGRRVYLKANDITKPLSGYGMTIVSTSKGLMTGDDANKQNLGGEIICIVW
jgi:small subunit ribosomal protein S8